MDFDIQNKNVIVSGGLSGIGYCIVKNLLKEKANIGIFDINKKKYDTLEFKHNENVKLFDCDLSQNADVKKSINDFFNDFGSIDILINNAGILYNSPLIGFKKGELTKHSISSWNKVLTINLNSVFYMTRYATEVMIKRRTKGVVVNLSSISSSGNSGQSAYSASKAGVNALTKVWAKELGPWGIRVFAISPGYVATPSTLNVMSKKSLKSIIKNIPLKELGEQEEIASFLVSCIKNKYINGKILEIDGGLTL